MSPTSTRSVSASGRWRGRWTSVSGGCGRRPRRSRIAAVAGASGLAENTIRAGLRDLDEQQALPAGRVRKPGAGPKRRVDTGKTLLDDLKRLVDGGAIVKCCGGAGINRYGYYAVPDNIEALRAFREGLIRHWLRTLRRRTLSAKLV